MTRPPGRKRPLAAIVLAVAFLVLTAATVIGAVLSSGGDDDGGENPAAQRQDTGGQNRTGEDRQRAERNANGQQQTESTPAEEQAAPEQPAEPPADEAPAPAAPGTDPARGAQLNEDGFALIQQGDYAGAVPILEQAVASFPQDSQDLNYAYALYNLGLALNRSGRPDEAIPILEKRLTFNNQRGRVKQELELARSNAGQG